MASAATAATLISYEKLPELTAAQNMRVSASRLEAEAAKAREGHLGRSFLPQLEVYGAQESFKIANQEQKTQPAFGGELSLPLYSGGRDQLESERRNLTAKKKEFASTRVRSEELQKSRMLFWEILYLQEKLALLEASVKVNSKNLQSALRRIRSGVATDSDRFEFEMKEVDLKREQQRAQLDLSRRRGELAVHLSLEGELQFPTAMTHDHEFEKLLEHSHADHEFLYKEHELESDSARLASKSVGREWIPRLKAFAVYNKYNEREKERGEDTETVVGLRLSMDLGSAISSRSETLALLKEAQSADQMAQLKRREVHAVVESDILELKLLHEQVHEAEENIQRAEKYDRLTQSEYGRGVRNSLDVLSASEKLFDMKNKRLEIVRDFRKAKAQVLAKIGK